MPFSTLGFSTSPAALLSGLVAGGFVGAAAYRTVLRRPFSAGADSPAPAVNIRDTASNLELDSRTPPPRKIVRPNPGGLRLPASLNRLREADEPSLGRVNPFIDRLARLRFSEWVAIGRFVVENRGAVPARSTARGIVDATISRCGLGISAWHVRDAIETIAFLTCQSAPALSRSDRRIFFAAQSAAEDAAIALLVHACLPEQDLESLCAPFAAYGSSETVIGI
jgi:hypothetical protein